MRRRYINVVAPPHQTIADVADERSRKRLRVDPAPVAAANLKSTGVILGENGEIAIIGVRSGAVELAVKSDRMRRIVEHAQRRQRRIDIPLEEAFGQTEVNRKRPMELFAQALHRDEIV